MNEIPLLGLSGTNPLGAMAAFGLLRILSVDESIDAALSWHFTDDWHPTIHVASIDDSNELIDWLVERQRGRADAPFLMWAVDVKVKPDEYGDILTSALDNLDDQPCPSSATTRERCDFLAAFGSDVVTARSTGDVKPTAFHMTAGQQRFLKAGRETAASFDPNKRRTKRQTDTERLEECHEAVREALFGHWRYRDKLHSLGWDPTTEGLYALSDISPSDAGARSVPVAVWLGFESLPLFPSVPVGKRLVTAGFDARAENFTWSLWGSPLRIGTVRSLLASLIVTGGDGAEARLRPRGIHAVYRARCLRDGNGRGTFRNAVRIG